MFSKQEASQLKTAFWTAFGHYMKPVPFAEGEKNNWINYKTGERNIAFKMKAASKEAIIAIEITHTDTGLQQLYFEQFIEMKTMLHATLGEEWMRQLQTTDETGRTISRIYTSVQNVSIYNKADWSALISFFKPRIIALDEFWNQAKYAFEALR